MNAPAPPPFGEAYWVVPGMLMAGPHPGGKTAEETVLRVQAMLRAGIRCTVNLTLSEEEKPEQRYDAIIRALAETEALDVRTVRFALFDGSCPGEAAIRELLDIVDDCIAQGRPVYVHCMMGLGRTGVMVGCHLVRHGAAKPRAAIRHMRGLRSRTTNAKFPSPLTEEQEKRIRAWKPGL